MKQTINIFWFRRDLRLADNVGLYHALQSKYPVMPIFIFDKNILNKLPEKDPRVSFIYNTLQELNIILKNNYSSGIATYYGEPEVVYKQLLSNFTIDTIFTNNDYEPYAVSRDKKIKTLLNSNNIDFRAFKDHVIFEKDDIVKDDGQPYKVYTPYSKKWLKTFKVKGLTFFPSEKELNNTLKSVTYPNLSIKDIGFTSTSGKIKEYTINKHLISKYEDTRNFPAKATTSKLGPHLRFGTVSIRQIVKQADNQENKTFLKELIWREFFMQILWHFPHSSTNSFKPKYDRIVWRNNETEFKQWCQGKTGYPLVDAGMRQLNATGFMHNRVRMLVGSFLCKHLLIDWRWGEAYFAKKLHDYDMSSNVGNWQWVAGTGVDAAPYFRIFNPTTQIQKFDKDLEYIKKWVPDFQELTYPQPIVNHKEARERCLKRYKEALS